MSVPGLLLMAAVAAAPADGLPLASPKLARGDELVYRGEITEASDKVDNRFRKQSDLEVRVFVLEVADVYTDCAVITKVRPKVDPAIAGAASVVSGTSGKKASPPATRLEFVRVNARGQVKLLAPSAKATIVPLSEETPTRPVPAQPIDAPPALELGMFVPLPAAGAKVGSQWDVAEADRPPLGYYATREAVWNGGRCIELMVGQQTDGYEKPALDPTGWRRRETVQVSPTDGVACSVRRVTDRREGASVVAWIDVQYALQPTARYLGSRFHDVRREAEAAYCFAADCAALGAKGKDAAAGDYALRVARINRYLDDNPTPTGFREAIEAVKRRCEAGAAGNLPTVSEIVTVSYTAPAAPLAVGRPAPDFVASRLEGGDPYRLAASRGKPVLLVFYKPTGDLARPSILAAETLEKRYAGKADVFAVAVASDVDTAKSHRTAVGTKVPGLDGAGLRERFGVDSYPRFVIVDKEGNLAWQFEGYGNEVPGLTVFELDRMTK